MVSKEGKTLGKKTLSDVDLAGRNVLMRVDFNVPLSKDGDVADDTRIKAALPSIGYIMEQGSSVVLMSHLGRPKGMKDPALSLKVVAHRLGELTDYPVKFVEDCIGSVVDEKVSALKPGEILLLENVRFYPGETENDSDFSKQLSKHGDLYANDAFGSAHRAHASTEGVTRYFEEKVAGFLIESSKSSAVSSAIRSVPSLRSWVERRFLVKSISSKTSLIVSTAS